MCSDIRICTKTARFSCFYANVGIGGRDMSSSYFLPRLIGTGRAYEMMLTGNFISADEAWNLGLVSKVVEDRPALIPAGLELARVIAAKDPMAVRLTKEAMRANVDAAGFDNAPAGREPQPDPDDRPQRQQGRFSGSHRQVLDRGSYRSHEPQGCQLIDCFDLKRPPAIAEVFRLLSAGEGQIVPFLGPPLPDWTDIIRHSPPWRIPWEPSGKPVGKTGG